jgi:hypothetical protein
MRQLQIEPQLPSRPARRGRGRAFARLAVAALVLAVAASTPPSTASPTPTAAVGVEVEIAPQPERAGTFSCSARITNSATGEVLSEPRVLFVSGENATMRSGVEIAGRAAEVVMTVSADAAKHLATVRVELWSDGATQLLQAVKVQL